MLDLSPGVAVISTQRCAPGDACALVLTQLPPASPTEYQLIDVEVEAVFDNGLRHRVGTATLHPRAVAGSRVVGTVCVPGAVEYRVTWRLSTNNPSPGVVAKVGLHTSLGGAGRYGFVCTDLEDLPGFSSTYYGPAGGGTSVLLANGPRVVAEVSGINDSVNPTFIQLFDATSGPVLGDTPADEFAVPAGAGFFRSYPPRVFRRGLIVSRSTTWGIHTADPTGNTRARARFLER